MILTLYRGDHILHCLFPGNPDSVAGEFGVHSLYKMLGYFSLVGLLRLHSLLGDYYQALKVLDNIDFNKKVRALRKVCPQCSIHVLLPFVYILM
jgi:translation initiation factor 3 subunit L